MIHLFISGHDHFRFNDETGESWILNKDEYGNPVWVLIEIEEKKEK